MSCTSPEPAGGTANTPVTATDTSTITKTEIEAVYDAHAAEAARHILYLNKSEEYHGVLLGIAADGTVEFMTEKGEKKKFNRSEVERIEFTKPRKEDFVRNVKGLSSDSEDVKKYFDMNPTAEQYPDSNYLTAFEHIDIDLTVPGKAVYEKTALYKVLRKGGQFLNSWDFRYLADSEKFEVIYARSISGRKVKVGEDGVEKVDNGGEILNLAENALEDGAVNSSIRAYDNLHKVKFALKGVDEGDWVNFCVRKEMKIDALHPLQIEEHFADFEPMLLKTVMVRVPHGSKEFAFTTLNNATIVHAVISSESADVYEFAAKNTPRVEMEQDLPPLRDIFPTLIISRPASPAEFAVEFQKFLDAAVPDEKTAAKFKEILKKYPGIPPEQAFYFHIQKEFDRVNIPPSDYSWKPHTLEEIMNIGKGNSLDLTYLYYLMCKFAKLDKVLFCMSAPFSQGQCLPDAGALADFMTPLLYLNNDKPYKLSTGVYVSMMGEFRPFGYIPSILQGSAFYIIVDGKAIISKNDVIKERENARSTSITAELSEDGSIKVTKKIKTSGSYLEDVRGLSKLKPEELKLYFENMVSAVHSSAKLVSYKPDKAELENRSFIPEIEVVYTIDNYALPAGNFMAFKLPEIDYTAWEISKRERIFPLWWGYRNLEETEISVSIPNGWKIYYAGEGKSAKAGGKGISYDYAFSTDGKTIKFKDAYARHYIAMPATKYGEYLGCVDTRAAVAKELLVLEKE
jgi:hypothetical protein